MRASGLVISIVCHCVAASPAFAAWDCEQNYRLLPGVTNLEIIDQGIELTLLARTRKEPCARLVYDRKSKSWTRTVGMPCYVFDRSAKCEAAIPHLGLNTGRVLELRPDLQEYRQQWIEFSGRDFDLSYEGGTEVSACVVHGKHVWFSLAFYSGEGDFGVGGIGRSDPSTGKFELRHPEALRRFSSRRIAHDGDSVWLNTLHEMEAGFDVGLGLVRYHWEKEKLETFDLAIEGGPCGDMVNDIVFHEGVLWVATDLGLSRWFKSTGRWVHTIPSHQPEEEFSCEQVLEHALSGVLGAPGSIGCPLPNPLRRYYRRLLSVLRQ